MKKNILRVGIMFFLILVITGCEKRANTSEEQDVFIGKILAITKDEINVIETSGGGYEQRVQEAEVKLLDGPYEGEVIRVINSMDQMYAYDLELFEGSEIYTFVEYDEDGKILEGFVYSYRRDKYIYVLVAIFLILMVVVGGYQGLRTLLTLGLTLAGIYYMLIGIAAGGNAILLSMVICTLIAVVTMFLVTGFNRKSISAILGTIGGVLVSGIIAIIASDYAVLTGLGTTEAQMLVFTQGEIDFNFTSILFASILLGTLGAVMDVCMSIASAINEITEANPFMSTKDLFKSGMNIGRDVMGTMANTLILAYAGTSIFLILVFFMNDIPYFDIINMDAIATEIVRALSGTIGLVLSIPLTAYIAAVLEKKNESNY